MTTKIIELYTQLLKYLNKYLIILGFPGGSVVNNLPLMQETQVQSLDWEDALEKGMATPSRIIACRIPGTEEPGSSCGCKESKMTEHLTLRFDYLISSKIIFFQLRQKKKKKISLWKNTIFGEVDKKVRFMCVGNTLIKC